MCVLVSALVGHAMMMTDVLMLARRGHSLQVSFSSHSCESVCVCVELHIVVVMQAFMKLAENVVLYVSDQIV